MTNPSLDELVAEAPLRAAGFTDRQARFAAELLEHADLAAAAGTAPDDVTDWVGSLLPPTWICRLLANHVTLVSEATRIYERSNNNPHIGHQLDLRADALDANCRDMIIGPNALYYRIFESPL